MVAEEVRDDAAIKRVAQGILRWLNKHGGRHTRRGPQGGCAPVVTGRCTSTPRWTGWWRPGRSSVIDDEIKLAAKC